MNRASMSSPYTIEALAKSAARARDRVTAQAYDRAQATAHAIRAFRLYRQARRRYRTFGPDQWTPAEYRLAFSSVDASRIAAVWAARYAQEYHPRPHHAPRNPPPVQYIAYPWL